MGCEYDRDRSQIIEGGIFISRVRSHALETAVDAIMNKINNYELLSGDVVSDAELSGELGMSRTPVREAMMQLINDGILQRTSTRVVVKPLTLSDIYEILEIREAREIASAGRILRRGGLTDGEQEQLRSIHEQLCKSVQEKQFDENFSQDARFHQTIIEFGGNLRMLAISKTFDRQVQRLRFLTMVTPERYTGTVAEHQAILDALCSADRQAVKAAIRRHLRATADNFSDILEDPQWNRMARGLHDLTSGDILCGK